MAFDLLIRGGTIVDGSGLPGYRGDVGISDGIITHLGDLRGERGREEIDAEGHVVAPGFVDGHTHMDAQIFWDPLGTSSCWHGVTSVVMGNCGFSLAPCAEKDKGLVFSNLEMAEDISRSAMEAGVPWSWETFPELLDTIDKMPKGLNYAHYVGHSALRTYVMGERAMENAATEDEVAQMKKHLEAGMRAGAIGLSTTRSHNHRTMSGKPVASRLADWSEIQALVGLLGDLGTGIFEISRTINDSNPEKMRAELTQLMDLAVDSGVPFTFGSAWWKRKYRDIWRPQFAIVDDAMARGARVLIQGTSAGNCSLRSFETLMPFDKAPIWNEFRKLPLAEQERGLRDPEMRKRLVETTKNYKRETNLALPNALLRDIDWDFIFPLTHTLAPHKSIDELAKEQNKAPIDVMIDMALEHHLKLFFLSPNFNENEDYVLAMMRHPKSAITFTDSGAHVASVINSVQTYLLGYWVREREAMTMEAAVRKMSFDIASFWGLDRRGLLREGWHADVVVFDPVSVAPAMPYLAHDLPTGAERLIQKSVGIKNTVVNGKTLMRGNDHTGALPGQLMRGALARH
jgi:N-acyl-D-amino-acid deacylase